MNDGPDCTVLPDAGPPAEWLAPSDEARGPARKISGMNEPIFQNDTSRRIVHVDMDAFYASVEQRDNPALRGRPVAVGHAERRGVVATASYEARAFGVHSAMPSREAMELCPQLIFVEARIAHYRDVSSSIHEIFHRYTDEVEPLSLDEAYLDVTHNKLGIGEGTEVARRIKSDIRRELGLVASAGVSYNKFLAKIASDERKPDGLCTIHPDRAQAFIDGLKVEKLWGVGPATAAKLHDLGLHFCAEVRRKPFAYLVEHFGSSGAQIYKFVRGIDTRPVDPRRERKSVGCEETYAANIERVSDAGAALASIAAELKRRLARADFRGRTLTIKVRAGDFNTMTRSRTGGVIGPETPSEEIARVGVELLAGVPWPRDGVRLLGLTVSGRAGGLMTTQEALF